MSHEYNPPAAETDTVTLDSLDRELRDYLETAPTPEALALWSTEQLELLRGAEAVATLSSSDGDGAPIELPTKSIIAVPRTDGRDTGYIRRLARKLRRHPEATQPISGLAMTYIQPNGMVLTRLLNNGTHTALAAERANLPSVQLHGQVSVYHLDHDILPLPEDQRMAA